MKYLVTGGCGFIGSHLVDGLTSRGDSVIVLDDLSTGRLVNIEHLVDSDHVKFVRGSVLDEDLVDDCMSQVDICFHLASVVGVKLVVERPLDALLNNVRGADIVISAAARRDRRLVFSSTSEIYGKSGAAELTEDCDRVLGSPFKARWGYAISKAFGEALVHGYHRDRHARMTVVRLFNTVGPRQRGAYGMVLPNFVAQALSGDDLTVFGNGTQSRCFGHVLDIVHGMMLVADTEQSVGRAFNIGSSVELAIVELARRVIERTGSQSTIKLVPYDEAYGEGFEELGRRKPDTTAVHELTGWEPTRTIDEAIDDVVAYERNAMSRRDKDVVA